MGSGTLVVGKRARQPGGFTHAKERACSFGFRASTVGGYTAFVVGNLCRLRSVMRDSAELGTGRRVLASGSEVMVRRPGLEPGTG